MTNRWISALALLVVPAAMANADDAATKKALQAKYNGFARSFLKKDADAIGKMAAPGFTTNGPDGKIMDAKSSMAMLKQQMQMMQPGTTASFTVTKVSVKGDKATAETRSRVSMKQPGQDKKTHTVVMEGTSKDKWVKIGGDWKILEYREIPGTMTVDGKKMDPMAMGGGGHAAGKK